MQGWAVLLPRGPRGLTVPASGFLVTRAVLRSRDSPKSCGAGRGKAQERLKAE